MVVCWKVRQRWALSWGWLWRLCIPRTCTPDYDTFRLRLYAFNVTPPLASVLLLLVVVTMGGLCSHAHHVGIGWHGGASSLSCRQCDPVSSVGVRVLMGGAAGMPCHVMLCCAVLCCADDASMCRCAPSVQRLGLQVVADTARCDSM